VNTIEEQALVGRRRRRQYSKEFKARAVAECQGHGVSIAAIALHHQLNANLLRRWVEQAEGRTEGRAPSRSRSVQATPGASFVAVPLAAGGPSLSAGTEIRVEVRRGEQVVTISWPSSEALACGRWLRELLR
jgi:transposase-like protein